MTDDIDTPADLGDGWAVAAPDDQDMDGALLAVITKHFTAWTEANVHGVVVARNGALVYEHYFTGEDQAWGEPLGQVTYDAGTRHDLRSMTKSVTGLLIGIAFDRGWLDTIDTPVFSFFPEHDDLKTADKAGITLAHLLTMSPGLAWDENTPYSDPANSERQMSVAPDPVRYVLEQPLVRPPGISYNYGGGNTALLAAILKRASDRDLDALAQEVLFDPLGISDVEWVRYPDGTPIAASGLRLRPRDIAKFGQLVLDKGVWCGERVVSADWITQSITPQINGQSLFFYGYHWWLGRSLVDKQEVTWASAVGWGGQRMFIVPSHGLVVLVVAGLYDNLFLQPIPGEVVLRRYALASVRP